MSDLNRMSPSITLAILSSQHLAWRGLQKILESRETVRIVVQLHLWKTSAVPLAEKQPDVFILDMESQQDVVGMIGQIRVSAPKSKIVLLSGFEDSDLTREAFEYGVDGIILKVQPAAAILAAIEALYLPATNHVPVERHDGVDVDLWATFRRHVDHHMQPPAWPEGLTERKREIIRLVGDGLSNKDIADRLCISESTVRYHLTSIFDQIGVPNRKKLLIHTHHFRSSPA